MGKQGAPTLKTKCIRRLNELLGDHIFYNSTKVFIEADDIGHWKISYNFGLSRIEIAIWDEEMKQSPTWKIIWDILKKA